MDRAEFNRLLDELDGNSLKTLKEKNARYSSNDDPLHNFNAGGEIMGTTSAQACFGYLTKHLVALRDMIMRNDFSNREDFLEKCQDSINYIRFLWLIGNEERSHMVSDGHADSEKSNGDDEETLRKKQESDRIICETVETIAPICLGW